MSAPGSEPLKSHPSARPPWLRLGCLTVVVILTWLGWQIWKAAIRADQAEHNLHAVITTVNVLDEFLAAHPGEWPRSWDDLLSIHLTWKGGPYEWPNDSPEIRSRVHLVFDKSPYDFSDLEEGLKQLISTDEPRYNYGHRFQPLIERLQKSPRAPRKMP